MGMLTLSLVRDLLLPTLIVPQQRFTCLQRYSHSSLLSVSQLLFGADSVICFHRIDTVSSKITSKPFRTFRLRMSDLLKQIKHLFSAILYPFYNKTRSHRGRCAVLLSIRLIHTKYTASSRCDFPASAWREDILYLFEYSIQVTPVFFIGVYG